MHNSSWKYLFLIAHEEMCEVLFIKMVSFGMERNKDFNPVKKVIG
jgi:hypothetical protein